MKGTGLRDSWNWSLSPTGIYFMNRNGNRTLCFYEFATQKTFPLVSIEKPASQPARRTRWQIHCFLSSRPDRQNHHDRQSLPLTSLLSASFTLRK